MCGGNKLYTAKITLENKKKHIIRKEKLLTIGLITKNEHDKLERCLKSLMPIRESLDCEIIVTDTGSTDNTVEMAEKYSDKVLEFEWCNDFSAARNTAIDVASGIWFMWIDSDEWIENPEPLIEFFNSGDYENYLSASFNFRDYSSLEYNIYRDLDLFRMTVLFDGLKFTDEIHESIPISYPLKSIPIRLCHDGYIFETSEERQNKHRRNLATLIDLYEKDPDRITTIRYMVDQYRFNKEFEEAIKYCEKGIALIDKQSSKISKNEKAYKIHFLIMKGLTYLEDQNYEAVIDTLGSIEDDDPKTSYLFIDIYCTLSFAYKEIGDKYKESEYAQKYIDYYIKQDGFDKSYSVFFFNFSNNNESLKRMLVSSLERPANDRKLEDMLNFIGLINQRESNRDKIASDKDYVANIWILADKFKNYDLIAEVYKNIKSGNIELTLEFFEDEVYNYMIKNSENISEIVLPLSKMEIDNQFVKINKLIVADYNGEEETARNLVLELLKDSDITIKNISSEVLYNAIKYNINIDLIKRKLDVFKIGDSINEFPVIHKDFCGHICNYYQKNKEDIIDIKSMYLIAALLESTFIKSFLLNKQNVTEIYEIFCQILPKLTQGLYNKKTMNEDNIDIYPPLFRFGYYIEIADSHKENDTISYIKNLKKAVENYVVMEKPIKEIVMKIEEEISEENNRKKEFEQLSAGIKQKIYEQITAGNYKEALSIICQLQTIIPNDKELKELKSRLSGN